MNRRALGDEIEFSGIGLGDSDWQPPFEFASGLELLVPEGTTLAQIAQRWCLDLNAVTAIVLSAKSPAMVEANAAVSALPPLSPALH